MGTENEFAREVLLKTGLNSLIRKNFYENLKSLIELKNEKTNFHDFTNQKIIAYFSDLAFYAKKEQICISESQFDNIVDAIAARRLSFNHEQQVNILSALSVFPKTSSKTSRNYFDVWQAIEESAIKQMHAWTIENNLLLADCFYILNLGKISKFTQKILRRIGKHANNLNKHELLHFLFLLNVIRKPIENMIDIERNLLSKGTIEMFNIDEIGVIAMGFFKTETAIKSPKLLKYIFNKLSCNIHNVPDLSMVNILKILRYSSRLAEQDMIRNILDEISPHIHRFSLTSCLHVILIGTAIQQCHHVSKLLFFKSFL